MSQLEQHIEDDILFFLTNQGVSVDKIISEGYYNADKNCYMKRKSPYANPGISDISGCIAPYGRALYIEVKKPSEMKLADRPAHIQLEELTEARYMKRLGKESIKKYQHRYDQSLFIQKKLEKGAVAFFACDVTGVIKKLKDFDISVS